MTRRRYLLLALTLLLLLVGLALVPGVRWPVYGWLRGEAFYQGMPTSWWESDIQESYSAVPIVTDHYRDPAQPRLIPGKWIWYREAKLSPWDRLRVRFSTQAQATALLATLRAFGKNGNGLMQRSPKNKRISARRP